MFKLSLSISTKTGVHPSHTTLFVVATKENGVVITSPFNPKALMAICRAMVPLETKIKFFISIKSFSFSSNSNAKGPILVSHWFFHILFKYNAYSSCGGKKGLVTSILFISGYLVERKTILVRRIDPPPYCKDTLIKNSVKYLC